MARCFFIFLGTALVLGACASDVSTVVDSTDIALSSFDCPAALSKIQPLYDSSESNNSIRLAAAGAYGCYANVDAGRIVSHLISTASDVSGPQLWEFLVSEFPSTASPVDDKRPQAALNGIDALLAILKPGIVLLPGTLVNSKTNNPGSILVSDRTSESNSYSVFLNMAYLGAMMNRHGAPVDNLHTADLPWTTPETTPGDGCAFAASLLNFNDGLQVILSTDGPAQESYKGMNTFISNVLNVGCQLGCTLCGGSVSCTTCPLTLRDRTSCSGSNTDVHSCAAAGLVMEANLTWAHP